MPAGEAFTTTRTTIREALQDDGVAARIDALVEELLDAGDTTASFDPPRIPEPRRAAMIREARAAQARLRDDPSERARVEEVAELVAVNGPEG